MFNFSFFYETLFFSNEKVEKYAVSNVSYGIFIVLFVATQLG